ncbi:hypothetical protein EYZ11_001228 [Aspergillus tanneri]|uniref:EXS domain-containing protein n=1 Tax=Aspergillus tanneri TaxID=1220188 RepID=A0A4S3JV68_9EURO|nr:hypothetical protein EYZ11_001228 [Aspergillus tanneri]
MGPDQHAQLDDFSLVLPFPYRVAVILVAGFWGWSVNLHYLLKKNICHLQDVPALLRYPARHSSHQRPHHTSTYHLATLLTLPLVLSLLIFWAVTHGSRERVESLDYIPQSYLAIYIVILILPYNRLARSGRHRLLLTLRRISLGGLAETQDGKFGDILLADALTSYAKVLADFVVTFCMFFNPDTSSTSKPNRKCGNDYLIPLIIATPNIIRLRQCLIEYLRVRRAGPQKGATGFQHLANALKYATAFPVIVLAAKLRHYNPLELYGFSEISLSRVLIFFMFVNSAYSFYWDVTKDWDLTLFTSSRLDPEYPYGLRRHRYFSDRQYYLAIAMDLIIRFTWLLRFVPAFAWLGETEAGLFVLMFLEVARRWMWTFLRVETEWKDAYTVVPL